MFTTNEITQYNEGNNGLFKNGARLDSRMKKKLILIPTLIPHKKMKGKKTQKNLLEDTIGK